MQKEIKVEQKGYDSPKSNLRIFVKKSSWVDDVGLHVKEEKVLQERRITDWVEDGHTMIGYKWFDVDVVEEE